MALKAENKTNIIVHVNSFYFCFPSRLFFFLNVKIVKSTKKRVPFTEKTYEICFGLSWRINREKKGKTKAENNQSLTRTFHGKIERKKSSAQHQQTNIRETEQWRLHFFIFIYFFSSAVAIRRSRRWIESERQGTRSIYSVLLSLLFFFLGSFFYQQRIEQRSWFIPLLVWDITYTHKRNKGRRRRREAQKATGTPRWEEAKKRI